MKRKIVLLMVATAILGIGVGFMLRKEAQQTSNALTPEQEKLMRTPQGVIPMPEAAKRAMQDANNRRR